MILYFLNYAIEKKNANCTHWPVIPLHHYEFPQFFWKFTSHCGVMETALLDCINGNKNIAPENDRHQGTVNLTNNAQTSSKLMATGHA